MSINTNFDSAIISLINDNVSGLNIEYSKVVFTELFEDSNFATKFNILTGIRQGSLIPILNNVGKADSFPIKDGSTCDLSNCEISIDFSAKKWETTSIACKYKICIDKFSEGFRLFWGENKRIFGDANLEGALVAYLIQAIQRDLDLAIWRVAFFGDTNSVSPFLSGMDGIFTQAESMGGMKIVVTENDPLVALSGEKVYEYLEQAYNYASLQPWFSVANTKIHMTRAMASAYVRWLNALGDKSPYNCECYSPDGLTAQKTHSVDANLKIFGLDILVHKELDAVIGTTSLGLTHPYRALMTNNDNLLFGTTETDQLPAFDTFYSKDQDAIIIKGGASISGALVTNNYVCIGAETAI